MTGGEGATVYVIDDDEAVRDSLLFLLAVDGFRGQGFAGVDAFLALSPKPASGCIVTDLRMPGLDGADLLRLLPEHGIRLPVIVITGQGDAAAAARALAAGAFDFIEKPFPDAAILDALRAALGLAEFDPARGARARATGRQLADLPEPERKLLDWLMGGEGNQALGVPNGIALVEVERMRARIMQRMGVANLTDLLRLVNDARRYDVAAAGSR